MNKQPLFICVIFFALGIVFQDFNEFNIQWARIFLLLGILLLGLGFIKKMIFDQAKSLFLLIFFFSLGIFIHLLNSPQKEIFNFPKNKTQDIVFQLNKKLNSNEKNKRYEVEIFTDDKSFSAVMAIPKSPKELDFLHFYSAKAYINPTENPQYDFLFDYQKYLARQNTHYQVYIPNELSTIPKKEINLGDQIKQHRLNLLNKIDNSNILEPENKALLKGIILADRTEISQETLDSFSQTGLIHLLAISGSHMAIIFLVILFFLKPIFPTKYRNIPILLSIVSIWAFAVFINFGNSVVRSCIMISAYYIMVFLQRKPDLLHSMALAGFIILIWDTQQIFNIGFQLSFLAVLGIYGLQQPIVKLFGKVKNRIAIFFINIFALSTSAQISVAPLTIYYFHQFSFLSIFINVISIVFAQIFIMLSFILCILFMINLTPEWLLYTYDTIASLFLMMVKNFQNWDFGFTKNIPMEFAEAIILLIIIYFLRQILILPNIKNSSRFLGLILLFVLIRSGINFYFWRKEEVLTHHFYKQTLLSIKQNDEVIFFINDENDLNKIQKSVINPYITSRRINEVKIQSVPKNTKIKTKNNTYEIRQL